MIKVSRTIADTAKLSKYVTDVLIDSSAIEVDNKDKKKRKMEFLKELKEKRRL